MDSLKSGDRLKTHVLSGEGLFEVTSPFGERIHPVTGRRRFHAGIDGALWDGERLVECWICAWAGGIVVTAHGEDDNDAGVHVSIDHGGGLVTKYFHMEPGTLKVSVGDRVSSGQVLGYMGKTGLSTGEHLHFQVEREGRPVDPSFFLRNGQL